MLELVGLGELARELDAVAFGKPSQERNDAVVLLVSKEPEDRLVDKELKHRGE